MARPSVIPAVRERLELYLEELETAYLSQPDGNRVATIPATSDGKATRPVIVDNHEAITNRSFLVVLSTFQR